MVISRQFHIRPFTDETAPARLLITLSRFVLNPFQSNATLARILLSRLFANFSPTQVRIK